jgi:hypothetical protein
MFIVNQRLQMTENKSSKANSNGGNSNVNRRYQLLQNPSITESSVAMAELLSNRTRSETFSILQYFCNANGWKVVDQQAEARRMAMTIGQLPTTQREAKIAVPSNTLLGMTVPKERSVPQGRPRSVPTSEPLVHTTQKKLLEGKAYAKWLRDHPEEQAKLDSRKALKDEVAAITSKDDASIVRQESLLSQIREITKSSRRNFQSIYDQEKDPPSQELVIDQRQEDLPGETNPTSASQ